MQHIPSFEVLKCMRSTWGSYRFVSKEFYLKYTELVWLYLCGRVMTYLELFSYSVYSDSPSITLAIRSFYYMFKFTKSFSFKRFYMYKDESIITYLKYICPVFTVEIATLHPDALGEGNMPLVPPC